MSVCPFDLLWSALDVPATHDAGRLEPVQAW